MPDKRRHRGPHPEDAKLFAPDVWPRLRSAVADLSLLLSRGYADNSAIKLVGDRYELNERQRTAVKRSACSDQALARRAEHRIEAAALAGQILLIDGYNALTTIEAALSGAIILIGRDGCSRDMASMHGSYRKVQETVPAIELLGTVLSELRVSHCTWFLDRPVSNSGRLKQIIDEIAAAKSWPWDVQVVASPDAILSAAEEIVATADSGILDRCQRWFCLAAHAVSARVSTAWVANLS